MRNNTHEHSIFSKRKKSAKNPLPTCINLMNRDVFQLIFSNEHNLQVNNLYLYLVRIFDLDLVNFFLYLSPYFLVQFLRVDHLTNTMNYTLNLVYN